MPSPKETTSELFRNDVPALTTSLVRHGLVDLSFSPQTTKVSIEPRSSEDLTTADEEMDEWVRGGTAGRSIEGSDVWSGDGARMGDAGVEASRGVHDVLAGHIRAAQDLRRTLLSSRLPPADSPRTRPEPSQQSKAVDSQAGGHRRRSSSPTAPPAGSVVRDTKAELVADAATSAAVAASRDVGRGGRRGRIGGSVGAMEGDTVQVGASSPVSKPTTQPKASMAAMLDIAASLFGTNGNGGNVSNGTTSSGSTTSGSTNKHRNGGVSVDGRRVSDGGSLGKSGSISSRKDEGGLVTFTVDVHTGGSVTLGISVKELGGGAVLVEGLQKSADGVPGPAERAGVAVGDVILGINYKPLERGLVHTPELLAMSIKEAGFVKLQISRAVRASSRRHSLPGKDCAIVTELMWQTAQLRKVGILSSAERHTIAGFILQRMGWEEGTSMGPPEPAIMRAPVPVLNAAQMKSAAADQLDSLISQVKGLRRAICVRCLYAKSTTEPSKVFSVWGSPADGTSTGSPRTLDAVQEAGEGTGAMAALTGSRVTVRYVLRAEDVGTGREWLVFPRYSDCSELHQELLAIWPPVSDLPFPARHPVSRLLVGTPGVGGTVVEERIVGLEAFLHGALTLLGIYASVDTRCVGGLRLIQEFLGMPKDLFRTEAALPPTVRDQKHAELMLYRLLNQVDSPVAKVKYLLMQDFERDASQAPGVLSLLQDTSSRLLHLQEFMLERHAQQLTAYVSRSFVYTTTEERHAAMRRAVRRQVEMSLYLPLRRSLWKELASRLKDPARDLKCAIEALRRCPPSTFGVETPGVLAAEEWGPAKEAMGQATRRVLPSDQIEGLHRAAEHIAALYASLQQQQRQQEESNLLDAAARHGDRSANVPNGKTSNGRSVDDRAADAAPRMSFPTRTELNHHVEGEHDENAVLVEGPVLGKQTADPLANGCGQDGVGERGKGSDDVVVRNGADELRHPSGDTSQARRHDRDALQRNDGTALQGSKEILAVQTGSILEAVALGETTGEVSPTTIMNERSFSPAEVGKADAERIENKGELDESQAASGVNQDSADRARGSYRWRDSIKRLEISRTSSWNSVGVGVDSGELGVNGGFDSGKAAGLETGEIAVSGGGNIPERDSGADGEITSAPAVAPGRREQHPDPMGADDFLPMFALVLVHSAPLDLLLPQTLLTHLMDAEGSLSEAGYLVATLEAAVSFITQVYVSSCRADEEQEHR